MLSWLNLKDHSEIVYNQGNQFIGNFFIFFICIGVIILIYGNLVSIGIEYLHKKWFQQYDWLYVLILGVFGFVFSLYGMLAATLYAIIDKWLDRRNSESKSVKMLFLISIASLLLSWGYFQFTSTPMPPFTKKDAVKFATASEGTAIENFPKKIGEWEGILMVIKLKEKRTQKKLVKIIISLPLRKIGKKEQEAVLGLYPIKLTEAV